MSLAERYQNYANGLSSDLGDSTATTWWRATAADAEGRVTESVYGNGITTERKYDSKTGQLLRILSNDGVQNIQDLNYRYDNLNNVTERIDNVLNYTDRYTYDNLERLTKSTVDVIGVGHVSKNWSFDKIGNIQSIDNDVFTYDIADKLTAVSAKGNTYNYDLNGNQRQSAGKTIEWSSFNKPIKLSKGTKQTEFTYNADHSRMLKVNKDSLITTKTTQYFGNYEKVTEANGNIEHRYHIMVGSSAVAIKSVKTDSAGLPLQAQKINYLHKDALGSIDLITNEKATIVERLGFTPFGTRRDLSALQALTSYSSLSLPVFDPTITKRGFTGHEHIDELDLIHMNGRVYDPETGRFLSADPFVFNPYDTQGYNRYAYVRGNPLKYTDPSGFDKDPHGTGDDLSDPSTTTTSDDSDSDGGNDDGIVDITEGEAVLNGISETLANPFGVQEDIFSFGGSVSSEVSFSSSYSFSIELNKNYNSVSDSGKIFTNKQIKTISSALGGAMTGLISGAIFGPWGAIGGFLAGGLVGAIAANSIFESSYLAGTGAGLSGGPRVNSNIIGSTLGVAFSSALAKDGWSKNFSLAIGGSIGAGSAAFIGGSAIFSSAVVMASVLGGSAAMAGNGYSQIAEMALGAINDW